MTGYEWMYRLGFVPWERYATAAADSITRLLEREESERPPGRALDLGCGRGQYSELLAVRGWDVVGVDTVPVAIESAAARTPGVTFLVGDVTDLRPEGLGSFDLFLDVGCFQGLDEVGRAAEGRSVTGLARAGATLLMLAFGPSWARPVVGGVSRVQVTAALPRWRVLAVEPAETTGLGWPMKRSHPQWYRLGLDRGETEP